MDIMTHAKFHFSRVMLTLIFGVWASEPPPRAWLMTEKGGSDRVKSTLQTFYGGCFSYCIYFGMERL